MVLTGVHLVPSLSWTSLQQLITKYHVYSSSFPHGVFPKPWWIWAWALPNKQTIIQGNTRPESFHFVTGSVPITTMWPNSCSVLVSKRQPRRGGTVGQCMSAKNFVLCFYVFVISRGMAVLYSEQREDNEGGWILSKILYILIQLSKNKFLIKEHIVIT